MPVSRIELGSPLLPVDVLKTKVPALRDLVLVGGGHAQIQVVERFGMHAEPGIRVTLIAREVETPYSGMLPGLVAGHYEWSDVTVDLTRLCTFADVRFIDAEVDGLDLERQEVRLVGRPPVRFDALSINVGGTPGPEHASPNVTPVKPIGAFLPEWQKLEPTMSGGDGVRPKITVVGGGAGGVELALALDHRGAQVTIATRSKDLVQEFNRGARRRVLKLMGERGIDVRPGFDVESTRGSHVVSTAGEELAGEHVFWVTGVSAPAWPRGTGLALDDAGFIAVDEHLQSTSHPMVFAAGDVASMAGQPRPKSGVYAVRQGPYLAENLRRYLTRRPLKRFRAQRNAMAIMGLGDESAIAVRGAFTASGAWVWRWKQWIDRRFMRRFTELPEMKAEVFDVAPALRDEAPDPMRCGGCGAKLGANVLDRVLRRLDVTTSPTTVRGIGDDAAIVEFTHGRLVTSCDGFRAMIDDPYQFGRISAHHALSDLFAMGGRPTFALAIATVPVMADALMEEDLFQMMAGALAVFRDHDIDLVGGHSAEASELSVAFSVSGILDGEPMTKDGLREGQKLVLTKPLGTGTILAAAMRGDATAKQLRGALDSMDSSSAAAAQIFSDAGATGCTDVTGFGLLGHLSEMTRASTVGARLFVDCIPDLAGAHELMATGIVSSLQENNEQSLTDVTISGGSPADPRVRLLVDPQTAGGLLAAVPAETAQRCMADLRENGYPRTSIIGEVTENGLEVVL